MTTIVKTKISLSDTVRWIRKNCKGLAYQDAKKKAAAAGVSVYPRAWGAARKGSLKATLTEGPKKKKKKAAKKSAKKKPAKRTKKQHQGLTLILERNGMRTTVDLHSPHLSLEGDTIRIVDKG